MELGILICLILLVLIVCGTMGSVAYALVKFTKYLNTKDEIEKDKIYATIDIEQIDGLLKSIIEREFNEYHKFHPELSQEGAYIKRDEIKIMVTEITTRVYNTMTPALKFNLGLIYNIDNDDNLVNLIGERVSVIVMALAATLNSTLIDDSNVNIEI